MDSDSRVKEKKQHVLEALEKGEAQLHLDARRPGVLVPEHHRDNHHLVLNLSYRYEPPDLDVNDWGVRETLSFNRVRYKVGVPWSAVYAILSLVTRECWMYPDDMPKEIIDGAVERQSLVTAAPGEDEGPRAILREVVQEKPAADEDQAKEPTPPRRGHLRVVK